MQKNSIWKIIQIASVLILAATVYLHLTGRIDVPDNNVEASKTETTTKQKERAVSSKKTKAKASASDASKTSESSSAEVNKDPDYWKNPSEKKPYPQLEAEDTLEVSVAKQRVYIKRGDQVLYTMLCSTGSGGVQATPTGDYVIEPERGETFLNSYSGEGANYWVSWKGHGLYLFHSVPIDEDGNYIVKEAQELGKKANSHGCIRLSVADAKWLYENAVTGMKVVIK